MKPLLIYVLESDSMLAEAVNNMFMMDLNCEVKVFSNPKLLFSELELKKPDLMTTGYTFSEMTGLDVLHKIMVNPKNHFPVIVLYAQTDESEFEQKARVRGAADCIFQPSGNFVILEGIRKVLDQYKIEYINISPQEKYNRAYEILMNSDLK
jgi:FixJ family two-component response regulator